MIKYIIPISFIAIIVLIGLIFYPATKGEYADVLYHVVLIPYDVTHKPMLPKNKDDEYLLVVNQSSFIYQLDSTRKQFEFRIANQTLNKIELKEIAKEMIPKEAQVKFYIF
jgi:hypothetical protein